MDNADLQREYVRLNLVALQNHIMHLADTIKPRYVEVILVLLCILPFGRTSQAQVIEFSAPMRGLNEIGPSISFGSTLGFSSISAIESNSDQFAEFLKYDITLPTVIDPSKLELANAGQLFAPADDWWPRYDVSSVSIADKLTQRFASRYAVPRSLDPFYNTPVIENSAWISSYNNRNLKPAEAADEDLEQPLLAGVNGYNIMGRSRHGGIYGVSFQQSPLSSPEPGAVPLVAALSCVPAIVVFRRRLRGSIQPP